MPKLSLPRNFNTEISSVKRDPYLLVMAGDRLLNPDEILQGKGGGQYALYDELLKDGHCYSILQKRYLSIISREWQVEPASKDKIDQKAADMVKYHLNSLSTRVSEEDILAVGFDRTCYNLLDATLKGFKPAEIIWNKDDKEIYPEQIKARSQQRFDFALGENGKWELRLLTTDNLVDGEPVAKLYPRKFFTHVFGGADDNPYGTGLGRSLWWNVYFKKQGIKFWLQFVDKFASPTALGKYPRGATKEQKSTLMDALLAIAADAGVSIPEDLDISLLEASRSGSISCYESLCGYMDTEMSKTVLGETLTTQLGSTGSYSASQTHNEVRKELSKADADLLSDTLNRTLIKWDVELNMPDAKPPRLWRNFEEAQDLDKRVGRDKTLFDMGFKLKAESVTEIYGDYYEESQQEGQDGGQITDEQFLANSGADAAVDNGDGANQPDEVTGTDNTDAQAQDTTDLAETLDYGSIIDRVLRWNNLSVGVEYLPGSVRFPGRKYSKKLRSGYGHLRGYKGNDREALDCYIYPGLLKSEPEGSDRIFLITQLSPEDGDFDEYKVLIGYASVKAARDAYLQEMPIDYLGGVKEITLADLEQFRRQPLVNLSDSFAENKPDPADLYTQQLQERSRPIVTNWIGQIQGLIEKSKSLEEVRDRLFDLYPDLDSEKFTELMGAAIVAAEAAGRYEVIQEISETS